MNENKITINSEEDAKLHIIIPLLRSLGFVEELQFEESFYVRLGRNAARIDNSSTQGIGGRYDILVRYQGGNLCIFEIKSTDQSLTDDDRDQAISYARLVHPICPLAVLSNGNDIRIFDVVTKELLSQSTITGIGGLKFTVNLDIEVKLRHEALLHFIGLSKQNLKTFCELQKTSKMQQLAGTEMDRTLKKYIPSLYVKRNEQDNAFLTFTNQQRKNAFTIIGPSGVGKTNWMCYMADNGVDLERNQMSLFYAGMDLGQSLIGTIADDFNVTFSSEPTNNQFLKNLSEFLRRNSSELFLFIDAIDEWTHENPSRELDNFINSIQLLNAPIKLVLSCKITIWPNFMWRNGNPSLLMLNLFSSFSAYRPDNCEDQKNTFSEPIDLNYYSQEELDKAVEKYSDLYHVTGLDQPNINKIIHDPFMLRLISEVYENQSIPLNIEEERLFRAYIEKKQIIIGDNRIRIKMSQIARYCLESGNTSVFESDLEVSIDQGFDSMVNHGILQRSEDSHGRKRIAFYFNSLRDYLISMDILRLDTIPLTEFKQTFEKLFSNSVGQSVVNWYYKYATGEQKAYLLERLEYRALSFLQTYRELILRNTPKLKNKVEPFSMAEIGLCVNFSSIGGTGFGFSILTENCPQLKIFESGIPNDLRYSRDVPRWHRSSTNFMTILPEEAAFVFYKQQLAEIVSNGKLNEDFIVPLIIEKLYALVYIYRKQFDLQVINPLFSDLPIAIDYLEQKLHELKAYMLATEEILTSNGNLKNVPFRKAELLQQNDILPSPTMGFSFETTRESFPLEEFELYIAQLKALNILDISPLLPCADIKPQRGCCKEDLYSRERKELVVKKFYEYFLPTLRLIISTNFPTLDSQMLPYRTNLDVNYHDSRNWSLSELWYINETEDKTTVTFDSEIHQNIDKYPEAHQISTTFSHVIQCHNTPIYPSVSTSSYTPLRNRIYKEVKERLEHVLEHFNYNTL